MRYCGDYRRSEDEGEADRGKRDYKTSECDCKIWVDIIKCSELQLISWAEVRLV